MTSILCWSTQQDLDCWSDTGLLNSSENVYCKIPVPNSTQVSALLLVNNLPLPDKSVCITIWGCIGRVYFKIYFFHHSYYLKNWLSLGMVNIIWHLLPLARSNPNYIIACKLGYPLASIKWTDGQSPALKGQVSNFLQHLRLKKHSSAPHKT